MIFGQGAFQAGPNDTPETIAMKRAYIQSMMPKFGSAKYVGEGIGQAATGFMIGRQNRKLNEAEGAGRKSADDLFARLFGTANSAGSPDVQGPLSVLGMTPDQSAAGGGAGASAAPDPSTPSGLGDAAMAALGKPAQHDHAASHPGVSHGDWLKYSNQSATRNDPLDPALVDAMSFLGDMGITMDVISGGQEAAGEGGARKGSVRHDHGKSADADFYKDGRKLDWNNPADLPILTEIVRTAKSRGVTGIGAGDDYMGPGRFHVGFGTPAVWGAGGKSANAPAWLVEAYNGASSGPTPAASAPTAPAPQGGIPIAELQMALQNPWLSAEQKGLITSMISEQQAASDPMAQIELQKAQIELEKLQNPGQEVPEEFATRMFTLNSLGIDPQTDEGKAYMLTGKLPEAPEPGYTTMTADEVQQLGLPPGSYQRGPKGEIKQIGGGGTTINNNMDGGGKFEEAFAKGDATTVETVYNSGLAAQRNLGRIDQLESILSTTPTGFGASLAQTAGEWGIPTEGLDEIQSAQAIINSLVPEQRQPGSGPMSDADLALFKQSLPRIINQPGGNQTIIATMRGIAEYDAEGARIVQQLRDGQLTRAQAFEALQNRKNPLEAFKGQGGEATSGGGGNTTSSGIQWSIEE